MIAHITQAPKGSGVQPLPKHGGCYDMLSNYTEKDSRILDTKSMSLLLFNNKQLVPFDDYQLQIYTLIGYGLENRTFYHQEDNKDNNTYRTLLASACCFF